jgi:hypothetical protein
VALRSHGGGTGWMGEGESLVQVPQVGWAPVNCQTKEIARRDERENRILS